MVGEKGAFQKVIVTHLQDKVLLAIAKLNWLHIFTGWCKTDVTVNCTHIQYAPHRSEIRTQREKTFFKSWHYVFKHQRAKYWQLNPSIMILLRSQVAGPAVLLDRCVRVWGFGMGRHTLTVIYLPICLSPRSLRHTRIYSCPRSIQLCSIVSFCNKKGNTGHLESAWYYRFICVCVYVYVWVGRCGWVGVCACGLNDPPG